MSGDDDWWFDSELARLRLDWLMTYDAYREVAPDPDVLSDTPLTAEQQRLAHEAQKAERAYYTRVKELAGAFRKG